MKKFSFLRNAVLSACVMSGVAGVAVAAPIPVLDPAKPGLNVQIPRASGYFAYPTDYGRFNGGSGIDQSGDGRLFNDNEAGFVRYNTTNFGADPATGTTVAMSTAEDWVMSFEWESTMQAVAGTVFEASSATNDVARFESFNSSGQYRLQGGDGSSGYAQIGAPFTPTPNAVHVLTLHYQAANPLNQRLDFYIDNVLVANDFASRGATPTYNVNFLQLGGGRTLNNPNVQSIDYFDNIVIGPVVPEPASMSVLALGGLALARRRR